MGLADYLKTGSQEGKEKHVPELALQDGVLEVWVGKETPHPNTIEHHIEYVEVFAVTDKGIKFVARVDFGPTLAEPKVTLPVNTDGVKAFIAVESCNLHGLWENTLEL